MLEIAVWTVALPMLVTGVIRLLIHPLAVLFELRPRVGSVFHNPLVSIVVPAYNEGVLLEGCVDSILNCGYARIELIIVDDGSTDDTFNVMCQYADDPRVRLISKPNGGKGSALNAGIAVATGQVFVFVDADGLFTSSTIPELLAGFRHERVGAVCGNDTPVNLDRPLTHLLGLLTHVGTGLARRAMSLVGVLPIVAGNSGAFRADVVHRLGGFRTDTIGEDLELTWRVQFLGYDVEFVPHAKVLAEVPSTWRGLWKQRVRWARGLIQTARLHRAQWLTPRGVFRGYLPFNLLGQLLLPVLHLVLLVLLPWTIVGSGLPADTAWQWVLWTGLGSSLIATVLALGLDRAWGDLKYLYVLPLWLPMSVMMSLVTVRALWLEATGAASHWNKLTRTGVRSVTAT